MNSAENLDPGERIEATVKPPAIRDGIDMASDEQCLIVPAVQGRPKISGGIVVNLDVAQRF